MQCSTLWVFFLSGVAALMYQIVWQRLLVFFSGSDVYSSTLVVAAFMAGLGVGHLAGGHQADRSSRRTNLLLFAIAELAIAAFSLLSRPLYYDLLYVRLGPRAIPAPALLARSFTENVERAASRVGALYGMNTLGAAAGALITTWLLLPHLGLEGANAGDFTRVSGCGGTSSAAMRSPVAISGDADDSRPGSKRNTSTAHAGRRNFPA